MYGCTVKKFYTSLQPFLKVAYNLLQPCHQVVCICAGYIRYPCYLCYPTVSVLYLCWLPLLPPLPLSLDMVTSVSVLVSSVTPVTPLPRHGYLCICAGYLCYPRYPSPSTGLPLYLCWLPLLPPLPLSLDRVTSVPVLVTSVTPVTPLPGHGYFCICASYPCYPTVSVLVTSVTSVTLTLCTVSYPYPWYYIPY